MPYAIVGGTTYQQLIFAAGYRGRIWNSSAYPILIYPALVGPVGAPTGFGTINGMAINAPLTVPPGYLVFWESSADNTYHMQVIPAIFTPESIVSYTADHTLTTPEVGSSFTNTGAAGEVIFTLPASPVIGYRYKFFVNAAQYLRVKANTGQTIFSGGNQTASAGYARSNARGAQLEVVAIDSTTWLVRGPTGSWNLDV
jgi:hypothetical protein